MRRRKREVLLWDLPRIGSADDGPAPSDEELAAYRKGSLSPGDVTRVEWRLAGSLAGRRRLAEIAGLPDAGLARPWRPRLLPWGLALASAAALVISVFLVARPAPRALPQFDVRAHGLARTREAPGSAHALPQGSVRVVAEPAGEAVAGLRFALYRQEGRRLSRLGDPAEVRVAAERGSAVLTARADRLVGAARGTRFFFLVVSDRALPASVALASPAEAATELREVSGGRVYPLALTILDATDGVP